MFPMILELFHSGMGQNASSPTYSYLQRLVRVTWYTVAEYMNAMKIYMKNNI